MFGLNPVKMTVSNNARSWTGTQKILQKTPTNSATSQGAEGEKRLEEEARRHMHVSLVDERKRNPIIRKLQKR